MFKITKSEENPDKFYVQSNGTTHGSFLRVFDGYQIKFFSCPWNNDTVSSLSEVREKFIFESNRAAMRLIFS